MTPGDVSAVVETGTIDQVAKVFADNAKQAVRKRCFREASILYAKLSVLLEIHREDGTVTPLSVIRAEGWLRGSPGEAEREIEHAFLVGGRSLHQWCVEHQIRPARARRVIRGSLTGQTPRCLLLRIALAAASLSAGALP